MGFIEGAPRHKESKPYKSVFQFSRRSSIRLN
ncbi:hypothetical protein LINPERHAP1_LOCUS7667 [Linum perenne]